MATQHLSPVPPAPVISHAYPMAKPGYGKRNAPDQRPPARDDFALLPARERYVAGFIDRLPQGAAMSVKQLAKHLPLYGQQAIGTSLNIQTVTPADVAAPPPPRTTPPASPTLWDTAEEPQQPPAPRQAPPLEAVAPHQRPPLPAAATGTPGPHHTEQQPHAGDMAHVRPAPSADRPEADQTVPRPTPPAPGEVPATLRATAEPGPSDAYLALARLGRDDHRLALSAADCATLEPLASAWLARGVSVDYLTTALTAGLPARIDSPAGLLHRRLTDKIPPHIPRTAESRSPDATEPTHEALLVECTNCRRPGPPQALPDGLCRTCHHAHTHGGEPTTPTPDEIAAVKAHIANLRNLLKPA
ncbi:hypothetical protein [Streptomyces sp. NRRL F-3218]|uniref:hypothetical protein n=1 Tax=Streptomyces sp. NRRL F-3218 TaxID=1463847 RepID=UPI0004CB546F|nr:hypothetical protein [Streptomyces sp. NRRL F-3218]